jgi:hypothetical protein
MRDLWQRHPLSILPFLDADTGGDGSGTGGNATSSDETSDGNGGESGTNPQTGKPQTQDEIDKIVEKRLARARKQWEQEAEEAAKKSAMSAEEKLKADLDAAKKQSEDAISQANQRAIRAEAKAQATDLGIKADRIAYALKLADLSDVEVGDDGEPDSAAIKAALEAVLADLPELKGAATNVGGNGSNPPGAGNAGKIDLTKLSPEEFAALQKRVMAGERVTL